MPMRASMHGTTHSFKQLTNVVIMLIPFGVFVVITATIGDSELGTVLSTIYQKEWQLHGVKNVVHRVLSCEEMFPTDEQCSEMHRIANSCSGDGCEALKALLMESHPVFHPQPATWTAVHPMQESRLQKLSLCECHEVFNDDMQPRAFVKITATALNDETELTCLLIMQSMGDI